MYNLCIPRTNCGCENVVWNIEESVCAIVRIHSSKNSFKHAKSQKHVTEDLERIDAEWSHRTG